MVDDNPSVGSKAITNSNGMKAFGGVLALVAILAGMKAFVNPVNQRVDFVGEQMAQLGNNLDILNRRDREHQVETDAGLAAIREKFAEIETQFDWLREVKKTELRDLSRRIEALEALKSDAAHAEFEQRIRRLEESLRP